MATGQPYQIPTGRQLGTGIVGGTIVSAVVAGVLLYIGCGLKGFDNHPDNSEDNRRETSVTQTPRVETRDNSPVTTYMLTLSDIGGIAGGWVATSLLALLMVYRKHRADQVANRMIDGIEGLRFKPGNLDNNRPMSVDTLVKVLARQQDGAGKALHRYVKSRTSRTHATHHHKAAPL